MNTIIVPNTTIIPAPGYQLTHFISEPAPSIMTTEFASCTSCGDTPAVMFDFEDGKNYTCSLCSLTIKAGL